jgi:large subunit ribosomal protein L4
VVLTRDDVVTAKSLRNLPDVHVLVADQLNAYDVLCADDVVFTSAALESWLTAQGVAWGDSAQTSSSEAEAEPQTEEESA